MTPQEIQSATQALLSPGFEVFNAHFEEEEGEEWLRMEFEYCGRHKYLTLRGDMEYAPKDIATQIELQPILDSVEQYPDHYSIVVRCWKRAHPDA